MWPAQDYTRITLESAAPIQYQMLLLKNPDRLVLDLEDVAVTAALEELAAKIGANDPYVKSVRVGRFKPGVVRLVFDLKAEVKPEVFTLRPIAEYGHRLVLDIYPAQADRSAARAARKNAAATDRRRHLRQRPSAPPQNRRNRSADRNCARRPPDVARPPLQIPAPARDATSASSSSRSTPATAAKIRAPEAAAARTKRT